MLTLKDIFKQNLNRLIKEKGLSQRDLALRIGLVPQALNKYVKGSRYPGLDILEKLASGLGVSPIELITPPPKKNERVEQNLQLQLDEEQTRELIFLVNKFGGWNFLYRYLKEELAIIEKNEKELNLDVAKKEISDHSRLSHKQKIITNLLLNKQEVEDE
ncbi:MAG: helix-turn-helix transcriptional regulator [Bdellovibrionales bacterium]|nr:helix-turn-helix transcriptional regulator [Bdellovibrionales bacterium]